jgi:formamidopyrimidine-DNA glycosylase
MDAHVVVGVGNIYANESLFRAGIRPRLAAGRVSRQRCELLAGAVRDVLTQAIRQGGTTLRDFVDGSGKKGYFSQSLNVYGREDQPCYQCGSVLKGLRIGQRATVYCPKCQQ